MPSKMLLRTLIVVEIVLGIIGGVVSFLTESVLPESLRAYMDAASETNVTGWEMIMFAAGIPLLIAALISSIGLFLFWRPARVLYLIAMIAGVLLTPVFGPFVDAGWGRAFEEAAGVVSGVILALVYFSPLKHLYEKRQIDA